MLYSGIVDQSVPPFIAAQLMVGAVISAAALLHLFLALHGVRRNLNFAFVVMAVFAAVEALSAPLRYLSPSIPDLVLGIKISQGAILAYAGALIWFSREFAGLRSRTIPAFITALAALAFVLHVGLPYSTRFRSITEVRPAPLPGGGVLFVPQGPFHPSLMLGHLLGILTVAYVLVCCVALWRDRNRRRQATAYSIGIAPLVLFAYPHGIMVNRGLAEPPHYYAFAFLGLVAVMSHNIISDAVRSLVLTREVRSNERRWRTLLENVSLLVLGNNKEGTIEYVNPFLLQTAELELNDLIGKPFDVLFPSSELPSLRQVFEAAMKGEVLSHLQTGFLTRSGNVRVVYWSNVLLYGQDDRVCGILSVGADVTERVSAEEARNEAIGQLKALKEQLEAENQYLRLEYEEALSSTELIGKSDAIRYVLHKINQVADTDATVLIEGETGVGKELVARAVHMASRRAKMPFIRVNCAALPPNLIESELFGHERGAFTGADRSRQGRFELADGGTLLLDEIGDLALEVQAKLLRVLQEGEYDRVGGTKTRKADVRVIASTNRNLQQDVAAGRFREDLYFRLQVFPITVPPLRDRREDIPLLIHHFVQRLAQKHGRKVEDVPMRLVHQLAERDWPGNVRELENVIERAIITNKGTKLVLPDDRPARVNGHELPPAPEALTLAAVERQHIERILRFTNGQIAGPGGAAEFLGLHPNTLRGRMSKLGVGRPG